MQEALKLVENGASIADAVRLMGKATLRERPSRTALQRVQRMLKSATDALNQAATIYKSEAAAMRPEHAKPVVRPPSAEKRALIGLADRIMNRATRSGDIVAGVVTQKYHRGPTHQLDCDGRVLAQLFAFPRHEHVDVDIFPTWRMPMPPPLPIVRRRAKMTLVVRNGSDAIKLVKYLKNILQLTRKTPMLSSHTLKAE